jgi:polysaccharide biosynthesis protein PslH
MTTSRARNVLIATSASFHPPYQGDSARLAMFINCLRRAGWRVFVCHLESEFQTEADYEAMRRRCDGLWIYRMSAHEAGQRKFDACDAWCPDGFADLVRARVAQHGCSVVIGQFVFFSKCFLNLPPSLLKVIDTQDVFAERRELFEKAGLRYTFFSTSQADEDACLARADLVIALSRHEIDVFQSRLRSSTAVELLTNPISPSRLPSAAGSRRIAFVGASNPANRAGLARFIGRAWQTIRTAFPEAEFEVVGKVGTDLEAPPDGVIILGTVRNLVSSYERAAIVINPVPVGTGLSSKSLEALMFGKCLVTTSGGARGLEDFDGAFMLQPDASDFGDAIVGLFSDPKLIAEHEGRATAAAARMLNWRALAPLLDRMDAHVTGLR